MWVGAGSDPRCNTLDSRYPWDFFLNSRGNPVAITFLKKWYMIAESTVEKGRVRCIEQVGLVCETISGHCPLDPTAILRRSSSYLHTKLETIFRPSAVSTPHSSPQKKVVPWEGVQAKSLISGTSSSFCELTVSKRSQKIFGLRPKS